MPTIPEIQTMPEAVAADVETNVRRDSLAKCFQQGHIPCGLAGIGGLLLTGHTIRARNSAKGYSWQQLRILAEHGLGMPYAVAERVTNWLYNDGSCNLKPREVAALVAVSKFTTPPL